MTFLSIRTKETKKGTLDGFDLLTATDSQAREPKHTPPLLSLRGVLVQNGEEREQDSRFSRSHVIDVNI